MTRLNWDQSGERLYETGVDHGVLYIPDAQGAYVSGFAWNGLTTVTEKPSGADSNPHYADNIKYLDLTSAEEFGGTIEAYTYPEEFGQCDGTAAPSPGISIGQQTRRTFGLCYRTMVGNDVDGNEHGYKLHLVYGAKAAPSERAYASVNDKPEALAFSWDFTTNPVAISGTNPVTGKPYRPASIITINSTEVSASALSNLEDMLYGTAGQDPRLPMPDELIALFTGTVATVTPTQPTFDQPTNTITIPTVAGVEYLIDGEVVTGSVVITQDTVVTAEPLAGYKFPPTVDNDWMYTHV